LSGHAQRALFGGMSFASIPGDRLDVTTDLGAMRVACFCGTVFDANPPLGMCLNCDAAPVICASSVTELRGLTAAYDEGLEAIRALPEAA
jgi:hypothetical protein